MLLHFTIVFLSAAKWVADIPAAQGVVGGELAEQVDFVLRFRIVIEQCGEVAAAEGKDVRCFVHDIDGDGLAAVSGEIQPAFPGEGDAVLACGLS